jgi:hypothetical protein
MKATVDFRQNAPMPAVQGSKKTVRISTANDSAASPFFPIEIGAIC